jgi:hypothetical protein
MEIKRYEQRILIPDDGKYLYNETAQVISDKVFLGINANENEWIEITEEQKQEIEKQLNEELEVE